MKYLILLLKRLQAKLPKLEIFVFIIFFTCDGNPNKKVTKLKSDFENSKVVSKKEKCLHEEDLVTIKKKFSNIVLLVRNFDKKEGIVSKMHFPITLRGKQIVNETDFLEQNNSLKNFFSLKKYNEKDQFIGNSSKQDIKFLLLNKQACGLVQISIGNGMYFFVGKVNDVFKIINIEIVG